MNLQWAGKRSPGKHREEFGEVDHAFSNRHPLRLPAPARILRPSEILHRDAAQMSTADPKAVDPAAQSALNGGVPDIVVDADRFGIQVLHDLVQVPNGCADQ